MCTYISLGVIFYIVYWQSVSKASGKAAIQCVIQRAAITCETSSWPLSPWVAASLPDPEEALWFKHKSATEMCKFNWWHLLAVFMIWVDQNCMTCLLTTSEVRSWKPWRMEACPNFNSLMICWATCWPWMLERLEQVRQSFIRGEILLIVLRGTQGEKFRGEAEQCHLEIATPRHIWTLDSGWEIGRKWTHKLVTE